MGRRIKPRRPCSVDGCEKPRIKNGYCNAHNIRFKRYGSPTAPRLRAENCSTKEESIARKKDAKRRHYLKNKQRYLERCRNWRQANPEIVKAQRKSHASREESVLRAREARRAWRERNLERERERNAAYKRANKDKSRANRANYRASVLQASPPWLTKEHKREIAQVYKESVRLSSETGEQYHVDHIVPLRGKTVCGLHVPWNLRAITASENQRRPRVWRDEE
jgi:hypothetical protein